MDFTTFGTYMYIRTVFQILSKAAFTLYTARPNIGMVMAGSLLYVFHFTQNFLLEQILVRRQ